MSNAWDCGITWHTIRTVEPTDLPVTVDYVQQQVIRVADTTAEQDYVDQCIRAATQDAELWTHRALQPQTWQQVLSGFPPSGRIVVQRPPLISIISLQYYDEDNTLQSLAVSPPAFQTIPSGAFAKAEIRPLPGETFPSTYRRRDAVTVTFRAGYEDEDAGEFELIKVGICLMVGELYKQRTLSVHAVHNTPSVLNVAHFWRPVY